MEVGGIFHISNLDPWQGSYSTGGGPNPHPRKKKEPDREDEGTQHPNPAGVTPDEAGVVHVDLIA
ncbi:MAG: hypothetical protein HUU16_04260 [Candidatus Omnitrophica bacterium]|nr:hypothetical protein [bacterium]NUN95365.1 hypothetical protein [Candidatus Omnitrophota bacterium]